MANGTIYSNLSVLLRGINTPGMFLFLLGEGEGSDEVVADVLRKYLVKTLTIKDIINKVDYLFKNNTSISYHFQEGDEEYDTYLENDYGEIYLKLNENDRVDSILENGCVIIKG